MQSGERQLPFMIITPLSVKMFYYTGMKGDMVEVSEEKYVQDPRLNKEAVPV